LAFAKTKLVDAVLDIFFSEIDRAIARYLSPSEPSNTSASNT